MLINVKSTHRVGDTLVPLIFMSDGKHLSNLAADNKQWPVYITNGNLSSKTRQMPSTHSIVMFALLPTPMHKRKIPQEQRDEQRPTNRDVLNEVLQRVHQPLTSKHYPSAKSRYFNVLCADGNFGRCKPFSAALLADCPIYSYLQYLEQHVCSRCERPKHELADYITLNNQHPWRDHNLYRMLSDDNTKAADAKLLSRNFHREFNIFRHIPHIVSDLLKPDLLHPTQIGMFDHLQKWIFHFKQTHKQLDKYNAILLSVAAYHDLTPKVKS